MADKVPPGVKASEETRAAGVELDPHCVSKGVDAESVGPSSSAGEARAKKAPPEQRRRCMSDKFMLYTYKIKLCKRQDPHNWRLCPYAHPGEAGRRRPPHMYQAVMCDFNKTQKECSHGEKCPLARNALEYWLHPDKYRTILCGHGEACNRNICFFAHNPSELRTPTSAAAVEESLVAELAAATGAFQQLHLAPQLAGAAGGSSAAQRHLFYGDARAACPLVPASMGPSSAAAAMVPSQALRTVQVVGPGGQQQQLLVHVNPAAGMSQLQLGGIAAGGVPVAMSSVGLAAQPDIMTVHHLQPQQGSPQLPQWSYEPQAAYQPQQQMVLAGAQPQQTGGSASPGTGSSTSSMVGPAAAVGPLMQPQMNAAGMSYYAVPASGVHPLMMGQGSVQQQHQQVQYHQQLQYQQQQYQQQYPQQQLYYAQQPSMMAGQHGQQIGDAGSSAWAARYVQEPTNVDTTSLSGLQGSLQQATADAGQLIGPAVPGQTAHSMHGLPLQGQPLQHVQHLPVSVATPPASAAEQHYFMPNW